MNYIDYTWNESTTQVLQQRIEKTIILAYSHGTPFFGMSALIVIHAHVDLFMASASSSFRIYFCITTVALGEYCGCGTLAEIQCSSLSGRVDFRRRHAFTFLGVTGKRPRSVNSLNISHNAFPPPGSTTSCSPQTSQSPCLVPHLEFDHVPLPMCPLRFFFRRWGS